MPPKNIGLDLRMWSHPGIGRYIRELCAAMARQTSSARFACLAYSKDRESVAALLPEASFTPASSKIYSFAEQGELSRFSKGVALLHVPHFNAPFSCHSKLVSTIHDLIYLKEKRFSGSMLGKLYVRTLIGGVQKNAKAVIAVSNFTKRDLEETFPKMKGKVRVIHEAAASGFKPGDASAERSVREKFKLGGDYFLYIGSLKAHKNLPVLLDAFEALWKGTQFGAELVVVGRKDLKETVLLARLEGSRRFARYLGELSDADLAGLYRGARALVIPSLWEGFGLMAVEAMASGTPVISSNRASLPEVVGDAGLLFDPLDVEALKKRLSEIQGDEKLRAELSKKGLERARIFSWENAAHKTLALYDEVLG